MGLTNKQKNKNSLFRNTGYKETDYNKEEGNLVRPFVGNSPSENNGNQSGTSKIENFELEL